MGGNGEDLVQSWVVPISYLIFNIQEKRKEEEEEGDWDVKDQR